MKKYMRLFLMLLGLLSLNVVFAETDPTSNPYQYLITPLGAIAAAVGVTKWLRANVEFIGTKVNGPGVTVFATVLALAFTFLLPLIPEGAFNSVATIIIGIVTTGGFIDIYNRKPAKGTLEALKKDVLASSFLPSTQLATTIFSEAVGIINVLINTKKLDSVQVWDYVSPLIKELMFSSEIATPERVNQIQAQIHKALAPLLVQNKGGRQ